MESTLFSKARRKLILSQKRNRNVPSKFTNSSLKVMVFGNKLTPFSSIRVIQGRNNRKPLLVLDTLVHIFTHP